MEINNEFENLIDELINKMSLKEKIGQLNQITVTSFKGDYELLKSKIKNGEIGSIILASSATAGNDAQGHVNTDFYNELQKIAVEESRLHIPMIYARDVIHGHRTVFPIPLAQAASFNPELIEESYKCIAKEAANDGIHWTFAPMLDLCRDPRWGRIIEGPGEDPYIGSVVAKAVINGFQGNKLSDENSLVACAKHYIGYGASEGGKDYFRTEISDYSLYNNYLPAFRSAIDCGVGTVMSSFNDINGQPVTSSYKYLTEILRKELSFKGFVISDWGAIAQLKNQGIAENDADAAEFAINAGLDMDMADNIYINNLEKLIKNGLVEESVLNESVRRILRIKFAKGLFDRPYCYPKEYNKSEHLKASYELASESMVLLKNNSVLPLDKKSKIALLGPMVYERRALLGSWTLDGAPEETENIYEAIQKKCEKGNVFTIDDKTGLYDNLFHKITKSDVVILALGESEKVTGEARSVADISLTKNQIELVNRVHSCGKKVVGVIFAGRPIAMEGLADMLDAVLYAWHSGSKTAEAVCDILFGDINPSGRTVVTFTRRTGHIPLYYNITPSGRRVNGYYENSEKNYTDSLGSPYYPFGYGLSYTDFEYGEINIKKHSLRYDDICKGEKFKLSIDVKNNGNFDGKEVVQLYINDKKSTLMRPLKELKKFEKVLIKHGESKTLIFEIGYDELGFYNEKGRYLIEKGTFDIYIGADCLTKNCVKIEIT